MHFVANGTCISPSDTTWKIYNIERNEGCMVIELVTILFLFADHDILTINFKNNSVHALPREIWHGYVSFNS